ncbi:GntR family transcriptional regulator, arabinose operon transcriptional repressor [Evansella caseinilytica]|uniref:GntR family transcriptional regulator, arabinose operon transcriptional repressor n=1 Tax=Evansella caseinilytica TaxID=1503961 RepID=A0A1H3TD86_9BACI|nr:GntR family transcriptional regulator [Evansella caseinilytica]SDZ48263.1 GntR family transcriptional regulator, arabinose operon transcriptional repressor [Evansella caseinilytica]
MKTKYGIVKQAIKSRILDGTYLPHQKISSENELMKEFEVSRHTIRIAVGELVNEGWLYREQGSGTFCADRSERETRNQKSKKNIAIITTYISDYIFPSIIRGAESYLSEQGFQVSLYSTNNNSENEKRILEDILSQNVDGAIIEPTRSAYSNPNINYYFNLERMDIPYIMINAFYDELEPLCLIMDDEKGGFIQTEHLIKSGHTDIIGFFKTDDIQGTKRMKGYIKAHRRHNIPINPKNIITYFSEEKNEKPATALDELLSASGQERMPTAIVCYNDELAMILLEVLRRKKLKVPDDISLVGYDDSFLAQVSEVKLTTVAHPKNIMGETAGKMIVDLVNSQQSSNKRDQQKAASIIYEPKLIIRQSTMPINS